MWFDTHLHTTFSTDSKMTLHEALAKAKSSQLGLVITEHMDLCYPVAGDFVFSVEDYFSAYGPYRCDRLLLGIEIGMRPECLEENREIVESSDFDMVIGSIHVVDNQDLYYPPYYEGKDKIRAYTRYLEVMAEMIEQYSFIDTLGHVDYICRYAPYEDTNLYYSEFSQAFDKILKTIADQNKALELNTRRLGDEKVRAALLPIYTRFAELGGKWITIGSDAHRTQEIGKHFAEVCALIRQTKLEPVYFKNRQPIKQVISER